MKKILKFSAIGATLLLTAVPAAAGADTSHDVWECVFYSNDVIACLFG